MSVQFLTIGVVCSVFAVSCSEQADPEPDVSTRGLAPAQSELAWPETIVAERNLFLPEGVEFDQTNSRFLVGSLREGSVFQLERDGRLTPVVEDPELVSSVGIEVDEARGRLLVVNSDSSIFTDGGVG